jgi:hypothetical protein
MNSQGSTNHHAETKQLSEKVGSAIDLFSALIAAVNGRKTCPKHERCDGSCTGTQLKLQPLQSSLAEAQIHVPVAPAAVLGSATSRNLDWSRNQDYQDFSYDPLDSGNAVIRLLKIKSAIFHTDIIECELVVASLNSGIQYNALSYTWGNSVFDQPIHINDKKTMITAGLQNALKAYRKEEYDTQDLPLWVDAVCINQRDSSEVTEQLLLMKRIYSEAKVVFVDLGDAEISWYQGHDLMQKLCMAYELEETRFRSGESRPMPSTSEILNLYRLPPCAHSSWKFYARMFASRGSAGPGFFRKWHLPLMPKRGSGPS